MSDRLRQLLYPLVLPLIVTSIWLSGWVRQQEDRMGHRTYAPHDPQAEPVYRVVSQQAGPGDDDAEADFAHDTDPAGGPAATRTFAAAEDADVDAP